MPFTYPYPRPSLTCDAVVFAMRADDLRVLLIQRKDEPFKGRWALPGGFVNENEALGRAAARELAEETGLTGARLTQLAAFGDPGRDPRGHTVTVAWVTFLVSEPAITAGDDAAAAEFHPFRSLALHEPPVTSKTSKEKKPKRVKAGASKKIRLAFDHAKIISTAYRRLCEHLDNPVRDQTFEIFPSRFTLAELQHIYEVVLGRALPARAFRKRLLEHGMVLPATAKPAPKPAAPLYRWNRRF